MQAHAELLVFDLAVPSANLPLQKADAAKPGRILRLKPQQAVAVLFGAIEGGDKAERYLCDGFVTKIDAPKRGLCDDAVVRIDDLQEGDDNFGDGVVVGGDDGYALGQSAAAIDRIYQFFADLGKEAAESQIVSSAKVVFLSETLDDLPVEPVAFVVGSAQMADQFGLFVEAQAVVIVAEVGDVDCRSSDIAKVVFSGISHQLLSLSLELCDEDSLLFDDSVFFGEEVDLFFAEFSGRR